MSEKDLESSSGLGTATMSTDNPRVFISYAREDESAARLVETELKRTGIETWIDHEGVRGGSWPKRLSEALEWCNTVVLIWSSYAIESIWVEREWSNAMALEKAVIPVLLDGTRVPPILASANWVDLKVPHKGKVELVREIKSGHDRAASELARPKDRGPRSLRTKPRKNLSPGEVARMLAEQDFYCGDDDFNRSWANPRASGITHDYLLKDQNIVLDKATGLKWQRKGSEGWKLNYSNLREYTDRLNSELVGGLRGWRVPTLEEAMSLVEPRKHGGLHIDPIFGEDGAMWTADQKNDESVWIVYFDTGMCLPLGLYYDVYPIRAVCSWS